MQAIALVLRLTKNTVNDGLFQIIASVAMVPFVQNTGTALLAKTTIAQVRPIHSLIGLNTDMRV